MGEKSEHKVNEGEVIFVGKYDGDEVKPKTNNIRKGNADVTEVHILPMLSPGNYI